MVHFKLFKNTNELPNTWDALPTCDIFLKKAFLSALEQSSPANIYSNYLCVYKAEKLVGIAVIQRVQMYTDDIFRNTSSNNLKFLGKKLFAKIVKGNALIIGNLMHTGQHGIFFLSEEISMEAYFKQLSQAIHQLKKVY
ncbi:hypothetical protein [Oceanihabitans sediminis]|uniref:hypothetical protein n=1 Tax=Oceanihabitans sediminis TaxID=1812012 RepID=UPI00299E7E21|nr:hypothetical protein [Oceanihabitans sediminis]MDX1278699.1 hypothetical protein [Oceanihabitans sediminis]